MNIHLTRFAVLVTVLSSALLAQKPTVVEASAKKADPRNRENPSPVSLPKDTAYLEATTKIGDEERLVIVVDQNGDGKFGDAADLWGLAVPGARPISSYTLSAMTEHQFTGGKLVSVKVEPNNSIRIDAADAKGPDPKDLASHRERVEKIWTERFDKEREKFVTDRKLDTSRPLAKDPIKWNYVTFAEAQKLAEKAKKPLFVDVMAFWCVWCYRMDYYTYPDAEVAKLLNEKFVPVKIIQEQAAAGEYDMLMKEKLKARGIPAMGIFDSNGEVLQTIGGWKPPADFVGELEKALESK